MKRIDGIIREWTMPREERRGLYGAIGFILLVVSVSFLVNAVIPKDAVYILVWVVGLITYGLGWRVGKKYGLEEGTKRARRELKNYRQSNIKDL